MAKFVVQGGRKLSGKVTISGSKNAALPILCACLLSKKLITLKNVPDIADINAMVKILEGFGAKIKRTNHTLEIDASKLKSKTPPEDLVNKMRASILVLGPLLARLGGVKMAFPGGCVLGKRSVSAHTDAFRALGCSIIDDSQKLHIKCKQLIGNKIVLPELSVTATENAIMAAVLADGQTEIRLAAAEPHVQDLCHFLNKIGAKISSIGSNTIKIKGVKALKGGTYKITGDYLEAGTFAIAAVATRGDLEILGINPDHLDSVWQKLIEMGANIELKKDSVHIHPSTKLISIKEIKTAVYPGFPTDLQAPFAVLLTQAKGVSRVFETLFEGRLNYLFELEMMGAHVEFLNSHQALIIGPSALRALPISSYDIRAGAAMIIAALIAKGQTEISNIHYIDRGYEDFDKKLRSIGAEIERVD